MPRLARLSAKILFKVKAAASRVLGWMYREKKR